MSMPVGSPLPVRAVVSREEWLRARIALLEEEKEFTRRRDALAAKVRDLPWVRIDKEYVFDTLSGRASLAELFGLHRQLIVYQFMFDPTWSQGCPSCSFIADHYNGLVVHLAHRDISFVTVAKAPIEQLEVFRRRMGWTCPWASAAHTDFSRDFGVSFTDEELRAGTSTYNYVSKATAVREFPGLSVFVKDDDGKVYHTYSTFARGLEDFLTAYRFIDITPKGRDEETVGGMGWLRHRDRYDESAYVAPWLERPGITMPAQGEGC